MHPTGARTEARALVRSRAAVLQPLIHISTDFHSNGSATERERGTETPEI
jgi:hypothetical protein